MNHISKDQGNHLAEINRLLSVYQVLSFSQLEKTFPDLTEDKLLLLLRKLEKVDGLSMSRIPDWYVILRNVLPILPPWLPTGYCWTLYPTQSITQSAIFRCR